MRYLRYLVLIMLLAIVAGCGGLSSEPAIVRTAALPTVTPTSPPDIGHPLQRVSLARGAEIFNGAQGCQNCHSISGQGNGVVASSFTCKIPNATDPSVAREASLTSWFAITTNGNGGTQTCLMPPWKGRLDEQQRWDVTSYLYSLHYTPAILDTGAKVWTANCTACHGASGAGDGPQAKDAARPVPNFSDPSYLITHSDSDLYNSVTHGIGAIMPAFDKTLSDDQRWAVVAYARSLSWEGVGQSAAATTPTTPPVGILAPESPTLTISGKVTNGTPGGKAPSDLALTLRILDVSSGAPRELSNAKTTLSGDSYTFKDVPRQVGQVYVVTTEYAGVQQLTTPLKLPAGAGAAFDLPLTVYEVSNDPSLIRIDVQNLFVDFGSSTTALIQQGLSFHNTGQRIYLSDQIVSGNRVALQMPLPKNAVGVTLAQTAQSQFTLSTSPPTVQSLQPMLPGESRPLQLAYTLPFEGQLTVSQPSLYDAQPPTIYVAEASGFIITDKSYVPGKPVSLQDANGQNVIYRAYSLNNTLPAGTPLQFTLASQNKVLADESALRRNTLAVVLTLALVVFALIGVGVWRISHVDQLARTDSKTKDAEAIIAQLAALDDRFEAGKLSRSDYEAQRAKLKAQIVTHLS